MIQNRSRLRHLPAPSFSRARASASNTVVETFRRPLGLSLGSTRRTGATRGDRHREPDDPEEREGSSQRRSRRLHYYAGVHNPFDGIDGWIVPCSESGFPTATSTSLRGLIGSDLPQESLAAMRPSSGV